MSRTETVHRCPTPDDDGVMPCCGRTPFEVPRWHRLTQDPSMVTCGKSVTVHEWQVNIVARETGAEWEHAYRAVVELLRGSVEALSLADDPNYIKKSPNDAHDRPAVTDPHDEFLLCEDTGAVADRGACPVHNGDACLHRYVKMGDRPAVTGEHARRTLPADVFACCFHKECIATTRSNNE